MLRLAFAAVVLLAASCRMPVQGGREIGIGWRPPGEFYVYANADPKLNEATSLVELDLEYLSAFMTEWARRREARAGDAPQPDDSPEPP